MKISVGCIALKKGDKIFSERGRWEPIWKDIIGCSIGDYHSVFIRKIKSKQ